MAQNNDKCPVCSAPMKGAVCETCGWIQINYPATVPQRIADYETARLAAARNVYAKVGKVDTLNNQLQEADRQIDSLKNDNNRLKTLSDSTKTEADNARKNAARAADTIKEKERQVTELRSAVKNLEDSQSRLERELQAIKSRPAPAAKPLKGVVMIASDESSTRTFLPVYEGVNTYGSRHSDGMHHQIAMNFRGLNFLPAHFSVETYGERLVIKDLSATITQAATLLPSAGMKTTPAMKFYLNNRFYIIVSEII